MPTFEFIETKRPMDLVAGDHIIRQDRFWRVIENHRVLGYPAQSRRVLMIVPEAYLNPQGFKFFDITTENRIDAYRRIE